MSRTQRTRMRWPLACGLVKAPALNSLPSASIGIGSNFVSMRTNSCPFDSRHRHPGDPEVYGAKEVPVGEIEGLPIRTAEGEVRCLWLAVDDAPELLALRIHNPDATRATTIDIPGTVHLHPVRDTGLGTAEIREHAICLPGQRTIWRHIERAYVPAPRVVDIEDAFVWRERETVGNDEIIDEQRQCTEVSRDPVHALIGEVGLVRDCVSPRIREVDRAVGLHHDVVRTVQ